MAPILTYEEALEFDESKIDTMAYMQGRDFQITEFPYVTRYPLIGYHAKTRDGFVELFKNGLFVLNLGFAWDGSSVPIIKQIHGIFNVKFKKDKRGSGEHDGIYRLLRFGKLPRGKGIQAIADQRYCDVCVKDGMSETRAKHRLYWLKKAGHRSTLPSSRQPVYYVP